MDNNYQKARQSLREDERQKNLAYKSVDYSGFFERFFAWSIDFALMFGIGYLLYKHFGLAKAVIFVAIIDLIYRIIFTYFFNATLGKLIFGVRIISRCSSKPSLLQILIREFFKYFSWLLLDLGFISIVVNRRKLSWHDLISGTAAISGGREEAKYARDIYTKEPQKWNKWICSTLAVVFFAGFALFLNVGSKYLIYDIGMFGFDKDVDFSKFQLEYKLPAASMGAAAQKKDVIQAGDIDGDRGVEVFREGTADKKLFIKNVRLLSNKPIDGDISIELPKPIIQFRLLDINGDKKDELAILFEDKTLKIYKIDQNIAEIGSLGPIGYKTIDCVTKGKPASNIPYRLYVLGDKNKVTVISMSDGKVQSQDLTLPGPYSYNEISMGMFDDVNYLVGLTDNGKVTFNMYDGKQYVQKKIIDMPLKGSVSLLIRDMNFDGKNELIFCGQKSSDRKYPVMASYALSGNRLLNVWNGGREYKKQLALSLDDIVDFSRDKSIDFYMTSKSLSGQSGKYSIVLFRSNKILMKVNDFIRILSFSKPI